MIRLSLILALGLAACSEPPTGTPAAPETASVPALAVSAQGETLETSVVGEAARLMLTRGSAAPVEVARGVSGHSQAAPRVAVTPGGGVLVLFVRDSTVTGRRFPSSDLFLARSSDGGQTFGAPVRVHADRWAIEGCPTAGPAVAAGADGRVHVAWYTGADGQMGLWHAVSSDGGKTFADPTPLAAGAPLGQTRAARDGQGRVWLAWEDRATARTRLAPAAGGDTLTTAGVDPALVGTAAGWALATVDGGSVRTRTN